MSDELDRWLRAIREWLAEDVGVKAAASVLLATMLWNAIDRLGPGPAEVIVRVLAALWVATQLLAASYLTIVEAYVKGRDKLERKRTARGTRAKGGKKP